MPTVYKTDRWPGQCGEKLALTQGEATRLRSHTCSSLFWMLVFASKSHWKVLNREVARTRSGFENITLAKMWPDWRQEGKLGGQSGGYGDRAPERWSQLGLKGMVRVLSRFISGTSTALQKLTLWQKPIFPWDRFGIRKFYMTSNLGTKCEPDCTV